MYNYTCSSIHYAYAVLYTFGLCENKDSSIATTTPRPPSLIGGSTEQSR